MNKFVTSKMVAEKAGVSRATVSHVLNGRDERVSEETRQRVLKVIEDLGYRPNLLARSMKTKKSQTVGVVIEGIAEGWFTQMILGMEEKLRMRDYQILLGLISSKKGAQDNLSEVIDLLLWRRVEGVIIITGSGNRETKSLKAVKDLKIPVVLVNFYAKEKVPFPRVMFGYEDAGSVAVNHLNSIGKKRIAIIGYNFSPNNNIAAEIFKGFKKGLDECNLSYLPELVKAPKIDIGGFPRDRLEFSKGKQRFALGRSSMKELYF